MCWFSGLGTRSRRRCRRRLARERRRGVSLLVVFMWWFSGRRRMRRLARERRRGVSLLVVFMWWFSGLRTGRRRMRRLARERRRGVSVSPSSSFQRFPILGLPFSSFKLLLFFVCWFSGLGTGSRRMRRLAREGRRSLSVSPSFSFQRFPVRRFSSLFFVWWLRRLRTRRRRRRLGCLARERQCCILGRHGFVVPKIKVGV
ncbi:hypothetical protein B0H13DRAFT_2090488, partial [Mycena leptocephala]